MKIYLTLFVCFLSAPIWAQTYTELESDSYVYDHVMVMANDLQKVREVHGGTKFIISYEGDWSTDMKGAFEYACKIWEETMPTTYPIHIKAILTEMENREKGFSKVRTTTRNHATNNDITETRGFPTTISTLLQMKGTTFTEKSKEYDTKTFDEILTSDMFYTDDIRITYFNTNNQIVDNFSFSIDGTPDNSRYDFVTMVLRDIAKGFGLIWDYNNPSKWGERLTPDKMTPFGNAILRSLGYYSGNDNESNDQRQSRMIENATQGTLNIRNDLRTWSLYAPKEWDAIRSLNYFVQDSTRKLTQLLGCDIARGTVIRDINDFSTYEIFSDLLWWRGDIAIGLESNSCSSVSTSTANVRPFGTFVIPSEVTKTNNTVNMSARNNDEDDWRSIIEQYNPLYVPGHNLYNREGISVSFLLNDGTWDIVSVASIYPTEEVEEDILNENFVFHHSIDSYARSCDGYLRCRVSTCKWMYGDRREIRHKYYLYDYLPQRPSMARATKISSDINLMEDEYFKDIKIDIKNLEGTTRIVVSQQDGEDGLPYYYDIPDYKLGYFIATVDKEVTTTFVITAYNKNGTTHSDKLVITPDISNTMQLLFNLTNNYIKIDSNKDIPISNVIKDFNIENITINANSSMVNSDIKADTQLANDKINISNLKSGLYVLKVTDIDGNSYDFKFRVK